MAVGRVSLDTGDRNMLLMITIITVSFLLVASATILYQGVSTLSMFIAILPLAISGVLGCVLDRRWVVLAVCATVAIVAAIILPESVPVILGVTLGLEGISYLSHLIAMVLFPNMNVALVDAIATVDAVFLAFSFVSYILAYCGKHTKVEDFRPE